MKTPIALLNLIINWRSARSAPQILSLKGDCTYLLLNFLIIGLCDSSAGFLLEIISFLILLLEALSSITI